MAGITKLIEQVIDAPMARLLGIGLGIQLTVAPGGKALGTQVGVCAGLGPLLVQISCPLTVLPAVALLGKPVNTACISANGATAIAWVLVLLPRLGSAVIEAAIALIVRAPVAGVVKLKLQVMLAPKTEGLVWDYRFVLRPVVNQ